VALAGLGAIAVSVRTAGSWRARVPAAGAFAAASSPGAPSLLLFVDPECPACEQAVDDLHVAIRPEELGVGATVVLRDDPANAPLFGELGPGLLPAYVLLDGNGHALTVIRGYRPPSWLRHLLREPPARPAHDRP